MITVEQVLTSGGTRPTKSATPEQLANIGVLVERVNGLLLELGITDNQQVTDGLRPRNAKYGAKFSAHKDGKAVDLRDKAHALALRITNPLLVKHKLRREDTDATTKVRQDGTIAEWCHLDTREPYGVFQP